MGNSSVYAVLWPIALALIALFGGIWIRRVSQDSDSAKAAAKAASESAHAVRQELHHFQIEVMGNYVRKDDYRVGEDRILEQMKVIDGKVTEISNQLAKRP